MEQDIRSEIQESERRISHLATAVAKMVAAEKYISVKIQPIHPGTEYINRSRRNYKRIVVGK